MNTIDADDNKTTYVYDADNRQTAVINGDLDRTESISNRWTRVGRYDLPASVTVRTASKAGLTVRALQLAKHKLGK